MYTTHARTHTHTHTHLCNLHCGHELVVPKLMLVARVDQVVCFGHKRIAPPDCCGEESIQHALHVDQALHQYGFFLSNTLQRVKESVRQCVCACVCVPACVCACVCVCVGKCVCTGVHTLTCVEINKCSVCVS